MQHLLVTLADSPNLSSLQSSLLKMEGIERVEALNSDPQADWKGHLHLPGPPLNDAQLEELAEDMNNETTFFTLEEARKKGYKLIEEWHSQSRL